MVISISTTEVVRHLGDYLARVKHKGERFVLTKNDLPVAELSPTSGMHRATWGELKAAVMSLPHDPTFADDLEKVNYVQDEAHFRRISGLEVRVLKVE